jgi:hypothetical protein
MTIYAMFLCFQASGMCRSPNAPLRSLAECEQQAQTYSGVIRPNSRGRFEVPGGAGMWYECRSKHVDTWQPAH